MRMSSTAYSDHVETAAPLQEAQERRRVAQQRGGHVGERADDERADHRAPDRADAADHGRA